MWVLSSAETSTTSQPSFFVVVATFALNLSSLFLPHPWKHCLTLSSCAKCYSRNLTIDVENRRNEVKHYLFVNTSLFSGDNFYKKLHQFSSFMKILKICCQISTKNIIDLHRLKARHLRLILNRFPSFFFAPSSFASSFFLYFEYSNSFFTCSWGNFWEKTHSQLLICIKVFCHFYFERREKKDTRKAKTEKVKKHQRGCS